MTKNNQSIHTSSVKEQKCTKCKGIWCPIDVILTNGLCAHCQPSPSVSEQSTTMEQQKPYSNKTKDNGMSEQKKCDCKGVIGGYMSSQSCLIHKKLHTQDGYCKRCKVEHSSFSTRSLPVQAESQAKEESIEEKIDTMIEMYICSDNQRVFKNQLVRDLLEVISKRESLSFQQGFLEGQAKAAEEIVELVDIIEIQESDPWKMCKGIRNRIRDKYLSHEKEESK